MRRIRQTRSSKPYAMLGAGPLVSAIWKTGHHRSGWRYRFNVYRHGSRDGQVSQLLRPADLPNLVKLCQVLATTLADDGCIPPELRGNLSELAERLDTLTRRRS